MVSVSNLVIMKITSQPLLKRLFYSTIIGFAFGFVCAYLASLGMADGQPYWGSSLMWGIVYNRALIGIVVFLAGALNYCDACHMKIVPSVRGFVLGCLVSLDLSIWFLLIPHVEPESIQFLFISSIIIGGVYGMITDVIVTKSFGDGLKIDKGWIK